MPPPLPMAPPALGVDLGGTKTSAVLLAADGSRLWHARVPTPAGDYAATLQAIAALVQQGRQQARQQGMPPPSVGVGSPGSETAAGVMKNCNSTCLNGQPLRADLQALLGQPIALANDANCLAWSEATDGAGAGASLVFAAILGTGAGAGIAINGQVLTGPNGLAGEWGHNPLPWLEAADQPLPGCYCGQQGCIETYVSGTGLAADHARHTGQALSGEDIVAAAASQGQAAAAARATLDRHAQRLARALAAVINLLDPDVIVLGGGLQHLPNLGPQVTAQWGRWVFSAGAAGPVRTRLALALHGSDSGVRGAAWAGRRLAGGAGAGRQPLARP